MVDDDDIGESEESDRDIVIAAESAVVTDYSACVRNALRTAEEFAANGPGGVLTCEHLLLGLTSDTTCAAAQVLDQCGFTSERVVRSVTFIRGPEAGSEQANAIVFSPRVERVLLAAGVEAGIRSSERIDTLHLLFALIRERQGIAAAALETPGVGHEVVGAALSNAMRTGMTDPS